MNVSFTFETAKLYEDAFSKIQTLKVTVVMEMFASHAIIEEIAMTRLLMENFALLVTLRTIRIA